MPKFDPDAELKMEKELEKKKATATIVSESARNEFASTCEAEFGVVPNFNEPVMHWIMNGWIASQKDREWLSAEEKRLLNIRKVAAEKRRKTMEANRLKQREA